jgi:hypothetical protein
MAHLCPVRAYSDWIKATRINEGYVFRKLGAGDRPSSDLNAPMVSTPKLILDSISDH